MPDVAKTKGKRTISMLIFRKFSGPQTPYWGDPTPRRSTPSVPPSSCPPL